MNLMPELAAVRDSSGLDLMFVVEHAEPRRAPPSRAKLPAADHQRSAIVSSKLIQRIVGGT